MSFKGQRNLTKVKDSEPKDAWQPHLEQSNFDPTNVVSSPDFACDFRSANTVLPIATIVDTTVIGVNAPHRHVRETSRNDRAL